jgi:hypothetical protein
VRAQARGLREWVRVRVFEGVDGGSQTLLRAQLPGARPRALATAHLLVHTTAPSWAVTSCSSPSYTAAGEAADSTAASSGYGRYLHRKTTNADVGMGG